jgi:hypothetical protein
VGRSAGTEQDAEGLDLAVIGGLLAAGLLLLPVIWLAAAVLIAGINAAF